MGLLNSSATVTFRVGHTRLAAGFCRQWRRQKLLFGWLGLDWIGSLLGNKKTTKIEDGINSWKPRERTDNRRETTQQSVNSTVARWQA